MEKENFNQSKYIQKYKKENYKRFVVDLKPNDKQEIDSLIKKNGFNSNTDFILKCIEIMNLENNPLKKS